MKILILGRCDGWMGIHMRQFADGFRQAGHVVFLRDYRECKKKRFPWSGWGKTAEERNRRHTQTLGQILAAHGAEALLVAPAHPMFDFALLKDLFNGPVIFFDMDGPALPCYAQGRGWVADVDLLVTVSRLTERELRALGYRHVHYLPHGVDPEYFAPLQLRSPETERFAAPLCFVGRPTPRRAAHLETVAQDGLALWGRRWSKGPFRHNRRLRGCVREKNDIHGPDLVKLYNAAQVVTNILREPFSTPPTIMSLQVFAVPASGVCLLTEWVEEIEEAFEPGEELLTFRSPEEFREKARRYAVDPRTARRIGEAGRKRCLSQHTHTLRAREFIRLLGN